MALVLLLSVRLAQEIAERISRPISRLAMAAQEVSEGRRGVAVPLPEPEDEVRVLSNSFNLMTRQLDERRDDLVSAREEAEQRRRFLETLLVELSSGVIWIDSSGPAGLRTTQETRSRPSNSRLNVFAAAMVTRSVMKTVYSNAVSTRFCARSQILAAWFRNSPILPGCQSQRPVGSISRP